MSKHNGIQPTGYRVLVEPDTIPETVTAEGSIVIPDEYRDQYQNAQPTGTLRAIGTDAWADKDEPWAGIGDRVAFDKYTGLIVNGEDGTEYRLINDTGIMAVISDEIRLGQLERRSRYEQ